MSFLFDPATRDLQRKPRSADLPLASVATMHFDSAGIGSFPSDGQVMIPDMKITLEASLGSEDVTVTLNRPGQLAHRPVPRHRLAGGRGRNVTLVAAGQVAGDDFSISISASSRPGRHHPAPRPEPGWR